MTRVKLGFCFSFLFLFNFIPAFSGANPETQNPKTSEKQPVTKEREHTVSSKVSSLPSDFGKIWVEVSQGPLFSPRDSFGAAALKDSIWVAGGRDEFGLSKNDVWSYSEEDGWQRQTSCADFHPRYGHGFTSYKNKLWVVGGWGHEKCFNDVWNSQNGSDWQNVTLSAAFSPRYDATLTAYKGKLWLMGGTGPDGEVLNEIWSSDDGKNWRKIPVPPFPPRYGHEALVVNDQLFVMGGCNGSEDFNDVWKTKDGSRWEQLASAKPFPPRSHFRCVFIDDRFYVIGGKTMSKGASKTIWSSTDASDWESLKTSNMPNEIFNHQALTYNDRIWMLGGNSGAAYNDVTNQIFSTDDGIRWENETKRYLKTPSSQENVVALPRGFKKTTGLIFKDRMWLFGADPGSGLLQSGDGITWNEVKIPWKDEKDETVNIIYPFVLKNQLHVIETNRYGTGLIKFWISQDGLHWKTQGEQPAWNIRPPWNVCTFKDKAWVYGPIYADQPQVYFSKDSQNWENASYELNFPERPAYFMNPLVRKDSLWMIGAAHHSEYDYPLLLEVFRTNTGTSWKKITQQIYEKTPHINSGAVLAIEDKIWLIGSSLNSGYYTNMEPLSSNGILTSNDGVSWTWLAESTSVPPRYGHTCFYFMDKIWWVGGCSSQKDKVLTDIWCTR